MDQDSIIEFLQDKFGDPEYNLKAANLIYRYYIVNTDPSWDLNKVRILGIGKVVASNFHVCNSEHPIAWNYGDKNTYHFLVVINPKLKKAEDFEGWNGILLSPIHRNNFMEWKKFNYGFPIFNTCRYSDLTDGNFIFSNAFNEEVEVEIETFDDPVPFSTLFNEKQQKLNDYIVEEMQGGDTRVLSNIVFRKLR